MKKFYAFLLTMLLAAGVLAGCGESAEQPKEEKRLRKGRMLLFL